MLVAAALLNVALVGAYVLAFYAVVGVSEKASAAQGELGQYLDKGGSMNTLKRAIKNTTEEREKLETYFVDSDSLVDFIEKVESLGGISGTSLVPSGLREQGGDILLLNIRVEGGFRDTIYLMELIQYLPFEIAIRNASLGKGTGSTGSWGSSFTLELTGFVNEK